MEVQFVKSASGNINALYNGKPLHSNYNPAKEAERFVASIPVTFYPKYILITEPCLSYTAQYFKQMYNGAIVCAIRYTNAFKETDKYWDKVFYLNESQNLAEELYNYFGEEGIVSCLFVSWKPSQVAFETEYLNCWKHIKNCVIKSRNVLATRSFFASRWIKNTIRFCLLSRKFAKVMPGEKPILMCASGPSLENSIPFIKRFRNYFNIICVSSAIEVLLYNQIIPDLCISTDGGYYAKKHFCGLLKNYPHIPVALSHEGAAPGFVFNNPIIPLDYKDGPGSKIIASIEHKTTTALRNGTVSGTAVNLALNLTRENIFCIGLDLAPSLGFSHTQPNILNNTDSTKENRFYTCETRITPRTFESPALKIYENWFASTNFHSRVFRLSNNYKFSNNLNQVQDLNWQQIESYLKQNNFDKKKNLEIINLNNEIYDKNRRLSVIKQIFNQNIYTKEMFNAIAPAEFVIYERSKGMANEKEAYKQVLSKISAFYEEIVEEYF